MTLILNKKEISKYLDIGPFFLFLDSAKILKKKNCAIGKLKIKKFHWTFSDHLLSKPIFPGTLLVETMCQTAMLIIYKNTEKEYSSKGVLRSVNITFKNALEKKLTPINLKSEAKKISYKRGVSVYSVKITSINNKTIFAEGSITHFISLKFLKKNKF